jgi:putative heme iron utilization protein
MQAEVVASIRSLLQTERVLSLAVVVDGEVEAGLLPYAVSDDHTALYVQASGLARHARGMQPGSQVGLLVHAADTAERDPMQLPRLIVHAHVKVLERASEAFAHAAERFTARFPASAMTLDLADFNLYELRLGRGRYIEGFARAFNVGPETFGGL